MKMKNLIIAFVAVLLVGVSIYTVNDYNASNSKDNVSSAKKEESNVDSSEDIEDDRTTETTMVDSNNKANDTDNVEKEKAMDFTLFDLEGKEISLSDLKGKKVFLNFWATWCPPCIGEMPEIEKLYQETKDTDLVIIAVDIGESYDTVHSFIKDKGYHFSVLLDEKQSVAADYNITSIPTSYFIDEEGYVVDKRLGSMNIDEMRDYIKLLD